MVLSPALCTPFPMWELASLEGCSQPCHKDAISLAFYCGSLICEMSVTITYLIRKSDAFMHSCLKPFRILTKRAMSGIIIHTNCCEPDIEFWGISCFVLLQWQWEWNSLSSHIIIWRFWICQPIYLCANKKLLLMLNGAHLLEDTVRARLYVAVEQHR